jgi:aldehyde dehydrogenase (NAD+)
MASTIPEIFESMEYGPAPESDKPALEWLDSHKRSFGHLIDGAFTKAKVPQFDVINPSTGATLA